METTNEPVTWEQLELFVITKTDDDEKTGEHDYADTND